MKKNQKNISWWVKITEVQILLSVNKVLSEPTMLSRYGCCVQSRVAATQTVRPWKLHGKHLPTSAFKSRMICIFFTKSDYFNECFPNALLRFKTNSYLVIFCFFSIYLPFFMALWNFPLYPFWSNILIFSSFLKINFYFFPSPFIAPIPSPNILLFSLPLSRAWCFYY